MRIGIIIYGDLNFPSGGFLYDKTLVGFLRGKGHHVEIFSQAWKAYPRLLIQNFDNSFFRRIGQARLDVLLEDELNHPSLFLLNKKIIESLKLPIVAIVHHLRISENVSAAIRPFYRFIEKRFLKSVQAMILNSETTKNSVARLMNADQPMLVAKPGADRFKQEFGDKDIEARCFQNGALQILFLGAIIQRKSPDLILRALGMLSKGDFVVHFAGGLDSDPTFSHELDQLVKDLDLQGQTRFHGHLREDLLISLIKKCQVMVIPSSYEGYGIAYAEGMSFGLPAVGTLSGGALEIIQDGKNGYLIQSGDADALTEILNALNSDRKRLFEMSLAAKQRFEELPSWEKSMQSIENFLISEFSNNGSKHSSLEKIRVSKP